MAETDDNRKTIERFAKHLDRDDFAAARREMAGDCVYKNGDRAYVGPDDILDSYRTQSMQARALFDDVVYESEVHDEKPPRVFTIVYTDHLRRGTHSHSYRCRQRISVDPSGSINRIVHKEDPAERSALDSFLARCGVDLGG